MNRENLEVTCLGNMVLTPSLALFYFVCLQISFDVPKFFIIHK